MKRLISIMMILVLAMGILAGCGTANQETESTGSETTTESSKEAEAETTGELEAETEAPAKGGEKVVTMGVTGLWMSLCHLMWPTKDVQQVFTAPMYDPVIAIDGNDGSIQPRVISSWSASDDNKVITVKINPDITWHDGTKLTANDLYFTFKMISSAGFECERISNFQYVEGFDSSGMCAVDDFADTGVKVVDDETLEFHLTIPYATEDFIKTSFYRCYVAPEHLLGDVAPEDFANHEFWQNPVGYGAFKFDSYIDGERMEYVKNENYYQGAPDFDRLIIKVVDASAMLSALKSGDVDMTAYSSVLGTKDLEMAAEDPNLQVTVNEGFAHDHLLINNKKFTTEQRKALNHIVNKEILAQAAYGEYAVPTIAMFNKNHPYYNPIVEELAYEYDPEKGVQLLEEAGFDFGKTYTIHVQSDQTQRVAATTALQQMFAEAGIQCEVIQADMATISAALYGSECDFAVMGSAGTPFDPLNELFYYWVDAWNQMSDPTMTEWGDEMRAALSFDEKYAISEKMQRYQMENTPMIYLYLRNQTFTISNRIQGTDTASFAIKNWNYWDWKVD